MYNGMMCAGIYLSEYNHLANNSFSKDKRVEYREYLQVRLTNNLTIGKVYRLEFFVHGVFLPDYYPTIWERCFQPIPCYVEILSESGSKPSHR